MIKKYIDRLLGRRDKVTHKDARPTIYGKDKHAIAKDDISRCARRTCEELQRAGHAAFVVGGAARDLLLGRRPKDFDIATSATPEQVRGLFRRSRIIGRRFRLVHVMFGEDTVEVSTFRARQGGERDAAGGRPAGQHEPVIVRAGRSVTAIARHAARRLSESRSESAVSSASSPTPASSSLTEPLAAPPARSA